ncbi:hypothetical protein CEXT_320151 [Caerostris extrusa]|uniref:Uncharacterized protein n=1 Tax=Caerostris extrusa TaxID=172846 RepID=A0AAV4WXV7_CAEEX|nr:hypothetical protein CEXT_320151 [Caerostris extrusa]
MSKQIPSSTIIWTSIFKIRITSRECQTDSHTTANNALWLPARGASIQQLNSTLCDPVDVLQKQRLNPSLANLGKEAASAETVNLNGD